MPSDTKKSLTRVAILLVAVLTSVVVVFFATRHSVNDSIIPPVLERANEALENVDISCEPLVVAMDAEGFVYAGRDRVGSLTSPIDLKQNSRK